MRSLPLSLQDHYQSLHEHQRLGGAVPSCFHQDQLSTPTSFTVIAHGVGQHKGLVTSFFLDCSLGAGLPEGATPPVYCAHRGECESYAEECNTVRRALKNKKQVAKVLCHLPFPFIKYLFGKNVMVHYTDGDVYLRCCVKGNRGEENSRCELMYPKPPPPPLPPPPPPDPMPKNKVGKVKWALKILAKFIIQTLMDLLGLGPCGGFKCDPFGEVPNPICLRPAGSSGFFADVCMYWGASGELFPEHPLKGPRNYKVIQMAMPQPFVEAAFAVASGSASPSTIAEAVRKETFAVMASCSLSPQARHCHRTRGRCSRPMSSADFL